MGFASAPLEDSIGKSIGISRCFEGDTTLCGFSLQIGLISLYGLCPPLFNMRNSRKSLQLDIAKQPIDLLM